MLAAAACLGIASAAQALTINVKTPDGVAISGGFRTIEEDMTLDVVPDVTGLSGTPPIPRRCRSPSTPATPGSSGRPQRHCVGDLERHGGGQALLRLVMPDNAGFSDTPTGYDERRADPRGQRQLPDVTVPVNKVPFKTAQISVFVFEDNAPTNGAADAPGVQEMPLCGWEVQLYEAGGTYGASGGDACPPTRSAIRWAPSMHSTPTVRRSTTPTAR